MCTIGIQPCDFARFGCTVVASQGEMKRHQEADVNRHVLLVLQAVEALAGQYKARPSRTMPLSPV